MVRFHSMGRYISSLLFLTLVLGACSPSISSSETVPTLTPTSSPPTLVIPSPTVTNTQTPTPTITVTPTITPTLTRLTQSIVDMPIAVTPIYRRCGADSPQRVFALEYIVYDVMKKLDPGADGFAETIDRGCTDLNGKEFTYAVYIYFYIDNKFVADLSDYRVLGSWIVDVMNLLDTIPRDEYTRYAQPTNAVFSFYTTNSDTLKVIVHIQDYWAKANGKSAEEIFQMFYKRP